MASADDMAALCALLADGGITAQVISPTRPIILQGELADGAPFDLRAFGNRVSLRIWAPGAQWQRTIHDGDGSTRQVPDVHTAIHHAILDGFAHGEAATLAADDLAVALEALCEGYA